MSQYEPFDEQTVDKTDRIAWTLCQIIDDDAPLRWTKYRSAAVCIATDKKLMADFIALSGEKAPMSLREAAGKALEALVETQQYGAFTQGIPDAVDALREALAKAEKAEESNAIAKLTEERDMWARKWQEERRRYAELRFPGMHGKIKALSVEAEAEEPK
jgi:hypothetical protein